MFFLGKRNTVMKNGAYRMLDEEKEYYSLTKRVWDKFAPFYDIAVTLILGVRDKTVSFTNAKNGAKILDVATGTGKQAFAFGKRGYDVIGVDISEAMLKVAHKKNKYGNVKFEVADATNLPFEDGSFDVSCVSFALHDMPLTVIEKTLKEMVRVIKPKGTIIVVDYALPKNKIGRFLIYHFVRLYESEYYQKFIKSDLEAMLRNTGIKIEEQLAVLHLAGRILKGRRIDN